MRWKEEGCEGGRAYSTGNETCGLRTKGEADAASTQHSTNNTGPRERDGIVRCEGMAVERFFQRGLNRTAAAAAAAAAAATSMLDERGAVQRLAKPSSWDDYTRRYTPSSVGETRAVRNEDT